MYPPVPKLPLVVLYFAFFSALANAEAPVAGIPTSRVVHAFDFDERKNGNVEEVPKFWTPLQAPGFPTWTGGVFDPTVGHDAPPSLHLSSSARNVALLYQGPETRVRPGASFAVRAFIRPDRLVHARACLSAHYLDREGNPLLESMVRSRYVGEANDGEDWVEVEFVLPPAPVVAQTMALGAWVVQDRIWNDNQTTLGRPIVRGDVHGGAWFDDIVVTRIPRIELSPESPGGVFSAADPPALRVTLADPDGGALEGDLSVRDADGTLVLRETVSPTLGETMAEARVELGSLPPGLYRATLDVATNRGPVATRSLELVRLGTITRASDAFARSFGLVLNGCQPEHDDTTLAFVQRQGVRSVKVPVWSEGQMGDESTSTLSDTFLHTLSRRGFVVTGVLAGPPPMLAARLAASKRPLLDLIKEPDGAWSDALATVAAPHAGTFRWWQLGRDGTSAFELGPDVIVAADNLRKALHRFITTPRLTAPMASLDADGTSRLPFEQVTVTVGSNAEADLLSESLRTLRSAGYEQVSAFVPPLSADAFPRLPRLAEWTQRVIAVRHAGADCVFVPQTWHLRHEPDGEVLEPREEFILLHTMAHVLDDAEPGEELFIAEGVRAFAFHKPGASVLALWDSLAPAEGRVHAVQLGDADRRLDLWGNATPLTPDEQGRKLVRLSSMPVLVTGVDRDAVRFATSWSVEPSRVEAGREIVAHRIRIRPGGSEPTTGQVILEAPPDVAITPRAFTVPFRPDVETTIEFQARYSHTTPAGSKTFLAKVTVGGGQRYFEIPLRIDLGLSDVDVSGSAILIGDSLVVRQWVGNRSTSILSFRGSAAVPGRERQYRPLANLQPGESQTVEYRFPNATDLVGRRVQIMLHELNDGPRVHTLQLTVP